MKLALEGLHGGVDLERRHGRAQRRGPTRRRRARVHHEHHRGMYRISLGSVNQPFRFVGRVVDVLDVVRSSFVVVWRQRGRD